jgi:hypothetical protein
MSAKKEKPALAAPVSENERPEAVDSTPSARTREHGPCVSVCAECFLWELRTEAVRLRDAVDDAELTDGLPVRVAEPCLLIGRYGRILAEDAEYLGVALNPEERAMLRLRDVADKPGGDA